MVLSGRIELPSLPCKDKALPLDEPSINWYQRTGPADSFIPVFYVLFRTTLLWHNRYDQYSYFFSEFGAGHGNRTHISGLEDRGKATLLGTHKIVTVLVYTARTTTDKQTLVPHHRIELRSQRYKGRVIPIY